jgi:DNA polymerase delta subunit 1
VAKGYKADCEVIYGDTDSVMVNFKVRWLTAYSVCSMECCTRKALPPNWIDR